MTLSTPDTLYMHTHVYMFTFLIHVIAIPAALASMPSAQQQTLPSLADKRYNTSVPACAAGVCTTTACSAAYLVQLNHCKVISKQWVGVFLHLRVLLWQSEG